MTRLSAIAALIFTVFITTAALAQQASPPPLVVSANVLLEDQDHFVLPGSSCTVREGAIGNTGGVDNMGGIFLLLDCPTSISKHTRLVEFSQMLVTANMVTAAPAFSVVIPHQP